MPKLWADSLDEHRVLVRRRLVEAFVDLVDERGIEDVTIAAVAARADLARSAVYNHVDHLHDLALLHAEQVMGEWLAGLQSLPLDHRGSWGPIEDLIRQSMAVFASDPLAGLSLTNHLDEVRAARLFTLLSPIMAHLHQAVAGGIAAGDLIDEDPTEVTGFVWATIAGYRESVGDGRLAPGPAADTIVNLLGRAIRVRGGGMYASDGVQG